MGFQDCIHPNVAYYYTKNSALNYFVLSLYKINLI
ncbi:hypothetical protein BcellWH2_01982 [Bacteroides cellulosilyticus]|uniref:Uncharacterized protein n=1 Tax=Bacteroides cellulosilyticus TaxID=246787 RepID=A0A0N7IF51_9BACE|nr:hypothetical protein BcellWH2_01982 [Bacteroides cellulosilyticus]